MGYILVKIKSCGYVSAARVGHIYCKYSDINAAFTRLHSLNTQGGKLLHNGDYEKCGCEYQLNEE